MIRIMFLYVIFRLLNFQFNIIKLLNATLTVYLLFVLLYVMVKKFVLFCFSGAITVGIYPFI